ncbi:MAG TPA: HdeD family acid-resistance protein [Xanthobacteraceae bacterium]|jgi:uncharacterized membrane protein HdeD (DUF308 family)
MSMRLEIDGKDMADKWWQFALLGIGLLLIGLYVLSHLTAATIATAIFFGIALLVGGGIQIWQAFSTRQWGGFLLNLLLGVFYAVCGAVLIANPLAASYALTLAFAAVLIASGIMRFMLAWRYWQAFGWLLLLSGAVAILAGGVILSGWPSSGLWVLGLVLGVDIVMYGVWWLAFAFALRRARPA